MVVGVALHSSTPSTISPCLVAYLSTKNVWHVGSHRPIGILESLADRIVADFLESLVDRIVADSAVSSDLSPDSAVTPGTWLPWLLSGGAHVTRFTREFHSGGILGQRLPGRRPIYSLLTGTPDRIEGINTDDGYRSDGSCVCRRDWEGFQRAPSLRRLLVFPSHRYRVTLPGFAAHPHAMYWERFPNVHRWFDHIKSDVLTDDDDQPRWQVPPEVTYGDRRPSRIRRGWYDRNRQLEWFLAILAGRRAGDSWSQAVFEQEVVQQMLELTTLLQTVRSEAWGAQFSMAFTLSPSGQGLLSVAAVRNAVLACTREAAYWYQSPQYHRVKHRRAAPVDSLSAFQDDVPPYPNHEFYYTSMEWRQERARLAGQLRRLSQLLCSVEWTPYLAKSGEGYRSRAFPRQLDPGLVELNVRRMMGDTVFTVAESAFLNKQLTRWESTVFRVHVSPTSFADTDCHIMSIPILQHIGILSEDIDTGRSTESMLSDSYDSALRTAKF